MDADRATLDLVSIHAPWEGCDAGAPKSRGFSMCFNSRTLGRVRRGLLRLATRLIGVSIHAPWEGCDTREQLIALAEFMFQFTHPGKGATSFHRCIEVKCFRFNSRTLGRVRPRPPCHHGRPRRFNSRTLGRVRQSWYLRVIIPVAFQFTHPGKGATVLCPVYLRMTSVSIHAPWEGCDTLNFR